MLLSRAVDGFLLDRDGEAEDDLSPKTISLYRNCLSLLTDYLHNPDVTAVTGADLARFMTWLEKDYQPKRKGVTKLSGATRDNHWKAIRSLCVWTQKELDVPRIDRDLPRPVLAEEEIIPYSEDETRKILEACEYTREVKTERRKSFRMQRPTAIRDRAIILLLLETGIRLGELSRLKIEHVNLDSSEIHVHPFRNGKKSRARTIPFGKGCRRSLWHYREREREDALMSEPFFPIAYHTVQSLFARIELRTGIPGVYCHRFRHTFAIQFLRNGGDIFTLQRILGHSNLEMCRRYLSIAQSDIKDAHRRASPVDRWRL